MYRRIDNIILLILLIVSVGYPLSAATEKVSIPFQVKNFSHGNLRYQLNGETTQLWKILPNDNLKIVFDTDDKTKDTVYLQQQDSTGAWSLSTMLVWDGARSSWVMAQNQHAENNTEPLTISRSPKLKNPKQGTEGNSESSSEGGASHQDTEQYLSLAIGAITPIPLTKVKDTYYAFGYGADVSLAWHAGRHVITTDVFYQLGFPKNITVDIIHEGGLALSYGYAIDLGAAKVQPEAGGGLILHAAYRDNKLLGFYHDILAVGGLKFCIGLTDSIDLFLRGQVMAYKWNESQPMYTTIAGVGISARL